MRSGHDNRTSRLVRIVTSQQANNRRTLTMRYLTLLLIASFVFAVSSCNGKSSITPGNTTSEIHVFNNVTGAEITDGSTITLNTTAPLNTRQLRVMRTVHSTTAA